MFYRHVGDTNIEISEIGIGVWSLVTDWWGADINKAEEILKRAYELGINFYDTADTYGEGKGEEILAKVLGSKRDNIVILTKIGYDFYHKEGGKMKQRFDIPYLEFALKKSLERLKTDYIDILMLHNPKMNIIKNPEILSFLKSLKKDGVIRAFGVALGPTLGWGEEGIEAIKTGYESLEYIYNIIEQKPGNEFLKYDKIGHIIRVPHASDVLIEDKWPLFSDPKLHRSLKDTRWLNEAVRRSLKLKEFASTKGLKLSELALKFVLSNKNVSSVVPNIASIKELEEYIKVENLPELANEDLQFIEDYYKKFYEDLNDESIKETLRYK
ncbi:aldo/keto reductase [Sulfolobus tengchongensis]|uniref:Aldo/keto reductase n=1 Tax=Sulfolobus tengchongensis TaxID=207809 RepID=A0AAX4KZG1_9CREN